MGYSAFLGEMGISNNYRKRAIALLAEYALTKCDKFAALRKLEPGIKPLVIHQLAAFAFEDYSHSAASLKQCDCCNGAGFIQPDVFTNKFRKPEGKMTVAGMVKVKKRPLRYSAKSAGVQGRSVLPVTTATAGAR